MKISTFPARAPIHFVIIALSLSLSLSSCGAYEISDPVLGGRRTAAQHYQNGLHDTWGWKVDQFLTRTPTTRFPYAYQSNFVPRRQEEGHGHDTEKEMVMMPMAQLEPPQMLKKEPGSDLHEEGHGDGKGKPESESAPMESNTTAKVLVSQAPESESEQREPPAASESESESESPPESESGAGEHTHEHPRPPFSLQSLSAHNSAAVHDLTPEEEDAAIRGTALLILIKSLLLTGLLIPFVFQVVSYPIGLYAIMRFHLATIAAHLAANDPNFQDNGNDAVAGAGRSHHFHFEDTSDVYHFIWGTMVELFHHFKFN